MVLDEVDREDVEGGDRHQKGRDHHGVGWELEVPEHRQMHDDLLRVEHAPQPVHGCLEHPKEDDLQEGDRSRSDFNRFYHGT